MPKKCNSLINCNEKKDFLFEKDGYPIMECIECGHRFTEVKNPQRHAKEVYSDNYFFEGKQGYPNYLDGKDILYKSGISYSKIVSKYTKPGKVLDVGCAAGFILKGFEKSGWQCHGIEPNETMANYGRTELGLNITTGLFENFESIQRFNLINMIQVIGHFYDIDKVLFNVSQLLRTNGLVLVESWNMKSINARILGKQWHEYSPPSVVNWFSNETLIQLFEYYGLRLIQKGSPSKSINVKHALSLFEEKSPDFIFKKKIIRLLNKTAGKSTLMYPPTDIKWYLFKKI
jgi:2-polyprenyl-3-methyl-5-hydroxy-6-metoxy-1,4-benzoquinol methylase